MTTFETALANSNHRPLQVLIIGFGVVGKGVLAGLLGLVTYMAAIARLGAARASLSAALVPVTTALGAVVLLGEPVTRITLGALALVTAGVALAAGLLQRRA